MLNWRPMNTAESSPHPSLMRRLTAIIYDFLLVLALVAVVNALALAIVVKLSDGTQEVVNAQLVQGLSVLSIYGFFILFWLKDGQTLGMQAWRVKLVNFQGAPPTLGQTIRRCLGATLSTACLGLGYLWCLVDRNDRYWHDYLSGTELILLPRPDKKKD